jgi:hypothetical protein
MRDGGALRALSTDSPEENRAVSAMAEEFDSPATSGE